jgi:hypothetical protein
LKYFTLWTFVKHTTDMVFDLFLLRTILLCIFLGQEELSLSWDEMLQIALDISHGIEYLHEGVC